MRSLIALCVMAACADLATAGPILDRIRARRAERQQQWCQPAPAPSASAPVQTCPGGVCPLPARTPSGALAPKAARYEYRCVNGRCFLVKVEQ